MLTLSIPLILLTVLIAAFVAVMSYRSLVVLSPWRRVTTAALRLLLVLLLLFAIFEVKWKKQTDRLAVLFVLDYSDSISTESKQWAQKYLMASAEQMSTEDIAGLLVFGEETYVEIAPSGKAGFSSQIDKITSLPRTSYTNIARALRLALAIFPEGAQRRVVLLTDGEENLGDARGEAIVAGAGGVQIEVVPLQETRENEVLIERLLIPPRLQQDTPFDIKLLVNSTQSGPAQVHFFQDGHYVGQQEVELAPGKNIFAFPQKIEQPGFHTFEARIDALGDHRAENNNAVGYSVVHGPSKVLYLAGTQAANNSPVPRHLKQEGIDVEVRGTADIPSDLAELQSYDCLVIENIPAERFSSGQMRLIERYVHDLGGGFVMIGGRDSYGPGGYMDTPIEEALPVDMVIKDKRHFPSFAQVIVIDQSGSMGMTAPSGKQKIQIAAEGAIAAVELLNDHDYIGVLAVDTQPKWVSPLRKATNRRAIISDIATLRAGGGGIYVFTGLKEAFNELSTTPAMLRHIILFADGQDAEQHEGCKELVDRMGEINMTLTSVALGQGQDVPFLTKIAEQSGGRFHLTEDADQIPRIFTKETILAQRSYLIEEPFIPQVQSVGQMLRGIELESIPTLQGYVGATAKDRAEVHLVSHRTDPVLATWRYGLGKAVAFTSDAQPRWAQEWIGWNHFGKFWTQVVRWALRSSSATHLQTRTEIVQGQGTVVIDALDEQGEFLNFLQLDATVITPELGRIELSPARLPPGRYEATFTARETGAYMVSVVDQTADSPRQSSQEVSGISLSYPVEFKPGGKGPSLIKQLAETTGGDVLEEESQLENIFRHDLKARHSILPIWQSLIWFVVFLLPLDIALRRITLSAEQWQWFFGVLAFWKYASLRSRKVAQGADATLAQLKGRRTKILKKHSDGSGKDISEQTQLLQQQLRTAMEATRSAAIDRRQEQSQAKTGEKSTAIQKDKEEPSSSYTSRLLDAKKRAKGRTSSGRDSQ